MGTLDRTDERHIAQSLDDIAHREVSPSLDLWPSFQKRLAARARGIEVSPRRQGRMRRVSSQGRRAVPVAVSLVLLLVVLAVVVVPVAVPPVEAAMGRILRRSGVILVSPTQVPRDSAARGPVTGGVGLSTPQVLPYIGLADAQQRVSFPIRLPSRLPDGMVFRGAVVAPNMTTAVDLFFGYADGSPGMIHVAETVGQTTGGYAFPQDRSQAITINGQPALYFRGSWQLNGTWDEAEDSATISWEDGGYSFMVQASRLGITRDALVGIAESVR